MNTVMVMDTTVMDAPDDLTTSMVEVDAAAARAALADHLQLTEMDREHPAVVAVLAAVVAAGWRPPTRSGGTAILTYDFDDARSIPLFGASGGFTAPDWAVPPGRPRCASSRWGRVIPPESRRPTLSRPAPRWRSWMRRMPRSRRSAKAYR